MAERVNEIYSLLIPLVDSRLLVPRACIAEVPGRKAAHEHVERGLAAAIDLVVPVDIVGDTALT